MSVSLQNFVNVNITEHITSTVSGTRGTVALFTSEGENAITLITSMTNFPEGNYTNTEKYAQIFFDNGGVAIELHSGIANVTNNDIAKLDTNVILVANVSANDNVATMIALANSYTGQGISQKIFLARTTSTAKQIGNSVAVKYNEVDQIGAEMTIAAYLSQIDVYGIDTVKDYMFTAETTAANDSLTDTEYNTIISNNMNVDITLANAVRNCGGNLLTNESNQTYDIVNTFVKIVCHQTLTERLVALLATKLKNSDGIAKIYSTLSNELENYVRCGYLTTDKTWTDPTYSVTVGKTSYTIIQQGTMLMQGYKIVVLPMSSLTETQKAKHQAPQIYVILATAYGIRMIDIKGEII